MKRIVLMVLAASLAPAGARADAGLGVTIQGMGFSHCQMTAILAARRDALDRARKFCGSEQVRAVSEARVVHVSGDGSCWMEGEALALVEREYECLE